MYVINMPLNTNEIKEYVDGLEVGEYKFKVDKVVGFKIHVVEESGNYEESYRALKDALKQKISPGLFYNVEKV